MRIGYEGSEGDERFALLLVYTRVPNGKGVRKLFAERRQIDEPDPHKGQYRLNTKDVSNGSLQALTRLGVQGGQIAAIRELLFVSGEDALRQTGQHMGASCTNGFDQGPRDKAPIHQDQHAWFERRQHASRQSLFGGGAGSQDDLDNGMGSGFNQVEAAHLR